MRITNGSLGIAAVAIGAYVVWHAKTGGPAVTAAISVAPSPGVGRMVPQGIAQATQGQLHTAAPYPGQAGPSSGRNQLPGFGTVPGANCPDTSTDGKLIPRTTVASQAWAHHWGVTPEDTLRNIGRGVPYP